MQDGMTDDQHLATTALQALILRLIVRRKVAREDIEHMVDALREAATGADRAFIAALDRLEGRLLAQASVTETEAQIAAARSGRHLDEDEEPEDRG